MNILMITDNDPAGMGIAFTNAINRYSSHTCRLITSSEKYGFDYEKDIHIPDIENDDFEEVEMLLKQADIIHFHVLKDENSHLGPLIIRDYIKGKKILHHHHGHPDYIINAEAYNVKYKQLKRRAIVSTPDLLKVADNAIWLPNLVPLNDVCFLPRYENSLLNGVVRICQSPTRKYHKHTREFICVVNKLRVEHPFVESLIIEKHSYFDCLKIKRACHIVFDHMRGWFGIASLESLSHGKPVIAGLDEWNIRCIKEFTMAEELPWIVAKNQDQLYEKLEMLITDKQARIEAGTKSRYFMENFWNEQKVLEILFQVYETI